MMGCTRSYAKEIERGIVLSIIQSNYKFLLKYLSKIILIVKISQSAVL